MQLNESLRQIKGGISLRDSNRIYTFCDELAKLWATKVPDWRFGQLIMNVFGEMQDYGRNLFSMEEDEMMYHFKAFLSMILCK